MTSPTLLISVEAFVLYWMILSKFVLCADEYMENYRVDREKRRAEKERLEEVSTGQSSSFEESAGDCRLAVFGRNVGTFVNTPVYHEPFTASITGFSFE